MDRALAIIARYVNFTKARGAERIIATATSAVREAANRQEFLSRVRERVGIDVEILSGIEEARLIALAVTEAINIGDRHALIIDIGGVSTEFMVIDGAEP